MAVLEQERHVELRNEDTEVYVVTSTLVSFEVDELPHEDVFVLTIQTREDPKDDTRARVATIADLTALPRGREAGLIAELDVGILYLTNTVRLEYGGLDEGIAAATTIKDRVNALITSWQEYDTDFLAPEPTPASYVLPSTDLSQLCTLIDEYKDAKQDRYQKELAQQAADDAQTAASNDHTYKYGLVTAIEPVVSLATVVSNAMTADKAAFDTGNAAGATAQAASKVARDAFQTLQTAGETYYGVKVETPPDDDDSTFYAALTAAQNAIVVQTDAIDTYDPALVAAQDAAALMAGHVTDAASLAANITALRSTYETDRDAAATVLANAETALITANQELAEALTLETTTLNAVLAVSPDFDKYTIPLLDDVPPP
jgi:hypothetical protein